MTATPRPIKTPEALQVTALERRFGDATAVAGVSFTVARGEVVGLLGPNGAGKTTTINMILGVLAPTGGAIAIDGIDALAHRSRALARTNFVATYSPLPGNLSVEQNLRIFARIYAVKHRQERIQEMLTVFDLERFRNTKCGFLSSGEQSRVAMAKALINEPDLLLLDEPTASLDPVTAREARAKIRAHVQASRCGVLWTSHNMQEVTEVCDRVLFLSRGRILLAGDPKTLPKEHGKADLEELFITVAREPLKLETGP